MRTSRLEAFSDGVFAIAATLLVLELRVPSDAPDLVGALLRLWPAYAAYLVSFLTIGIIWVNHHTLFAKAEGSVDASTTDVLAEIADLVASGQIEFVIAATYPLQDVRAAFTELEKRHTRGKIVLIP